MFCLCYSEQKPVCVVFILFVSLQAQALVGAYFAQDGVCQNMKKAVKMFKLAAEQEV